MNSNVSKNGYNRGKGKKYLQIGIAGSSIGQVSSYTFISIPFPRQNLNFLSIHSVSRSRFRIDGRSIVWRSPTFFARDSKKRFPPVGKRITKATAVVLFPIPGDSQCQSKRSRIEYTRSMEAQQRGSGVWTLRAVKVVAYFTSCLRNFLLVASFVRSRVPRPSHGIKFNACSQRINNSLIEQSRQSVRVRKLRTELKTLQNFFSNSES